MRAPFVVVDDALDGAVAGALVALDDDRSHHLRRVLRRRDGAVVEVTDGRGRVASAVLRDGGLELTARAVVRPPPSPGVRVLHAVPKARGLDEVVRTLAELGVTSVQPVLTARTEARPRGEAATRAAERWRAIARSAAEQARSAHECTVLPVRSLDRAAHEAADGALSVVADPGATRPLGDVVVPDGPDGPITAVRLLIGPEGGLTPEEVAGLEAAGWVAARAGATVLRSVHAATVLVAAVKALTGHYSSG